MGDREDIRRLQRDQGPNFRPSPRYNDTPRLTPDQRRDYERNRRLAYPNSYTERHASESARRAYETYSEHTAASKQSSAQYWTDYKRTAGGPQVPVSTLSQQQHRALTGSAAEAATNNHMNYQSRVDFIKTHPYGYSTSGQRARHEDFAKTAGIRADLYQKRYGTHHDGSGSGSGPYYGASGSGSGSGTRR